jgi:hypothetical protein
MRTYNTKHITLQPGSLCFCFRPVHPTEIEISSNKTLLLKGLNNYSVTVLFSRRWFPMKSSECFKKTYTELQKDLSRAIFSVKGLVRSLCKMSGMTCKTTMTKNVQ